MNIYHSDASVSMVMHEYFEYINSSYEYKRVIHCSFEEVISEVK